MKELALYIILPMIAVAMILLFGQMFGDINLQEVSKDDMGEPGIHATSLLDPGCHGPD